MRFCIIGTGRCGSTLLMKMLNLHPDVFVFNETHWIPKMYEIFGTGTGYSNELANILLNTSHVTGKPVTDISKDEIFLLMKSHQQTSVSAFCDKIGTKFAKDNCKLYWADKTPDYGPWCNILQRLWPDCKFIHLIRHGNEVAVSMSIHPGYQWMASAGEDSWSSAAFNKYYESAYPPLNSPLEVYASLWYRRLKRIRNEALLLSPESYKEFRFEAFETDPELTLCAIAEFANLSAPKLWIQNALNLLAPDKLKARLNARKFDIMGAREMQLLLELGYL